MLKAALFDLDGTLIDSFPAIAASVNHVRALRGLAPLPLDDVKRRVGRGARVLLAETVPAGDPADNLAAYTEHHPTVIREATVLLPGVIDTLQTLHGRGVRLGICSNKPIAFTHVIAEHFGLAPLLSALLGPEDAGRHKPAPDMLLLAMRRLGVTPAETLYVGDMTVDVLTGRAAGVETWAVATGTESAQTLRAAGATRVLAALDEITRPA